MNKECKVKIKNGAGAMATVKNEAFTGLLVYIDIISIVTQILRPTFLRQGF